ncbi:hypothetical protein D3C74_109920 [compost metagenome]
METRYQGNSVPITVHSLARAKVSDGKSVTVTVPQNTVITAGEWVLLDGFFGLAMQNVVTDTGETEELVLTIEHAEYETDQISTSQTFAKGSELYWNATTKKFTETGTDNRLVGRVTSGKDTKNVIWFLLGSQV